jgi:ferric-dicitrate binding protein FerR (iron transport regulator)
MMAALDGEISEHERLELEQILKGDAALRREWTQLERVKEVTSTMVMSEPPEEVWDDYWREGVYKRIERGIGWILVTVASLVLVGFGLWQLTDVLLADSDLPGFVKMALFSLLMGGAVLLASVIREKLFMRSKDPYAKVKR